MLRYLPVVLTFALTVYCVVDAIQTDEYRIKHLPKILWILLILLFPLVGSVAWLLAGRPPKQVGPIRTQQERWQQHRKERDQRRPRGPDDDPDFLNNI